MSRNCLILDEPAASLDPVARREFLSEVLNIANQPNRTVLFSTHITSDIERVADTVAILKEGKNRLSRRAWRAERFGQTAAIFGVSPPAPKFFRARRACRRASTATMRWWQRAICRLK